MTNYFSLPLELRQAILTEIIRGAENYDKDMVKEIDDFCYMWGFDKYEAANEDDEMKSYIDLAEHSYILYPSNPEPGAVITGRNWWPLIYFPAVHQAVKDIVAADPSIAPDLAWVLDTWADGYIEEDRHADAYLEWRRKAIIRLDLIPDI